MLKEIQKIKSKKVKLVNTFVRTAAYRKIYREVLLKGGESTEELMRMEDDMELEQILICRRLEQKRVNEGALEISHSKADDSSFSPIKQMQSFATSSLKNPDSYRSFILTKAVTKAKTKIKKIKEKIDDKLLEKEKEEGGGTMGEEDLDEASKKEFDLLTEDIRSQLRRFNRTKSSLPAPTSNSTSNADPNVNPNANANANANLNLTYNVKVHFQSLSLKLIETTKVKTPNPNSSLVPPSDSDSDTDSPSLSSKTYVQNSSPIMNLNLLGLLLSTSKTSSSPLQNFKIQMNNACLIGKESKHLMSIGSAESAWMCVEEEVRACEKRTAQGAKDEHRSNP